MQIDGLAPKPETETNVLLATFILQCVKDKVPADAALEHRLLTLNGQKSLSFDWLGIDSGDEKYLLPGSFIMAALPQFGTSHRFSVCNPVRPMIFALPLCHEPHRHRAVA